MEVECALLEGEHESEEAQLQKDKKLLEELKGKMHNNVEKTSPADKTQVDVCKTEKKIIWGFLG